VRDSLVLRPRKIKEGLEFFKLETGKKKKKKIIFEVTFEPRVREEGEK
jgi:hypothetical protein